MKHRVFNFLAAASVLTLSISLLYGGDLSEGRGEIREGELWCPASIDFEPWTRPAPTRSEKLQALIGITHVRRTSHPAKHGAVGVTVLRQYTIQDHYVVINLFWYRIGLMVLPLLWLVSALRVSIEAERPKEREEAGRCPSCGYDLCATPGRCPECGTVIQKMRLETGEVQG